MECLFLFSHLKQLDDTGKGVGLGVCLWARFLICENFQTDGADRKETGPTIPPKMADTLLGAHHISSDPPKNGFILASLKSGEKSNYSNNECEYVIINPAWIIFTLI